MRNIYPKTNVEFVFTGKRTVIHFIVLVYSYKLNYVGRRNWAMVGEESQTRGY